MYGDDETSITPPTANTIADVNSIVDTYPITLSGGDADNYSFNLVDGTLTITPSPVYVTANDDYIFAGDALPAFGYTLSGTINPNDQVVSGPTFSLSPNYSGNAGIYEIVPAGIAFTNNSNYSPVYVNGTFYVNPKAKGAKNVKPSLVCVDTLVNDPSGFNYIATYEYENKNNSPVFIPIGQDNEIVTTGNYSGSQPELFLTGTHTFMIPFDGIKMTWTVISYNGNQKASSASEASSTSNKCGTANGNSAKTAGPISAQNSIEFYPNPASSVLIIQSNSDYIIINAVGEIVFNGDSEMKEIDISEWANGVYSIRNATNAVKLIITH
jgi:hypothetical protein